MGNPDRGRALAAVALAQFMATLDMSIVNVALPAIRAGLGVDPSALPWVVNAYALFFGGFLLLGGRAADVFGQRRLLVLGTAVFAAASLVGGLARDPWQLIGARALQGLGAALMAPAALALLTLTQREGPERARALGVYAAVSAVGGSLGVLAGGLLAEYAGWRWVMLVNVPFAVAVVALAVRAVPPGAFAGVRGRLDAVGAVLATAGVGALILGVTRTEGHPWTSTTTLLTLAGAVALLIAFAWWERRAPEPLVRLELLAHRSVSGANLFMLLLCAGQFAAFYFVSLYLQQVLGLPGARAGLAFLPMCLAVVIGIAASTRLLRRVRVRPLLIAGGLLAAAGFLWLGLAIGPDSGVAAAVLAPSVPTGLGIGLCFVPLTAAATGGLPRHAAGTASALLNSARQIGGAIGLAALVTAQVAVTGGREEVSATTDGYGVGLVLAGACLLAAAVVGAVVLPRASRTAVDA
ncbi:DHA2 family efflux MFS transporter permease subunit [Actinokineospora auranticolor]|uniref:DHA2 family efflux MFS transporter permease subunit n=1 Tax=Actinokineospora auranticolor TaxID=155976 RepID=UPI001FE45CBE|nr:DHA2 family efflux MFS transporter permease subunit [Actinokineospora auranticolor]